MDTFFDVKRVEGISAKGLCAYWIESTAPLNVDDRPGETPPVSPPRTQEGLSLTERPYSKAIQEIAGHLNEYDAPEVVINVHGFNNPVAVVLNRFENALRVVLEDDAITKRARAGLVCIGYKWPSEAMFWPIGSSLAAAPGFLLALTVLAVLLLVLNAVFLPHVASWYALSRFPAYLVGLALFAAFFALPFAVFLLRAIVYFRDVYRATQYGVPDMVEVIRQLDMALGSTPGAREGKQRIKLSLIGHSMGGFVVTSLVRILSDVFTSTRPASSESGSAQETDVDGSIGRHFRLGRLVLVSPDIPAEALLTRRANFLGPSLRRFEEAYLFSNEGDEVLRLISTLANYFSFPTRSRNNGFRLGNTEVVDPDQPNKIVPPPGVVNLKILAAGGEPTVQFLKRLRVGALSLNELDAQSSEKKQAKRGCQASAPAAQPAARALAAPVNPPGLPGRFTYFDCTDYGEGKRTYLSRGKHKAKMGLWNHLSLLASYGLQKVDVHSGYFDGPFTRQMIYRLACLGFVGTLHAMNPDGVTVTDPLAVLDAQCRERSIQVLLSPDRYKQAVKGGHTA